MRVAPSTKATVFQPLADEIAELLRSGRLTQADLEQKLRPEDLRYLGKTLAPSSWVPIETSTRLMKLLFEMDGRADLHTYMRERGRINIERLRQAGVYKQFQAAACISDSIRDAGRAAITIASLMLNFTRWSFEAGEEGADVVFRIVVDDAEHYPELNRLGAEAFIEKFVEGMPSSPKVRVSSARVRPDRVVFTAERA